MAIFSIYVRFLGFALRKEMRFKSRMMDVPLSVGFRFFVLPEIMIFQVFLEGCDIFPL